jgi:hypothetical protein
MCVLVLGIWTATNFNLYLLEHWTSFPNSEISNWEKIHGTVTARFSTLQCKSTELNIEVYKSVLYQFQNVFIALMMLATPDQ